MLKELHNQSSSVFLGLGYHLWYWGTALSTRIPLTTWNSNSQLKRFKNLKSFKCYTNYVFSTREAPVTLWIDGKTYTGWYLPKCVKWNLSSKGCSQLWQEEMVLWLKAGWNKCLYYWGSETPSYGDVHY